MQNSPTIGKYVLWLYLSGSALLALPPLAWATVDTEPNITIQNLPDNTWHEVPDSKMEQVEAKGGDFPGIWGSHPDDGTVDLLSDPPKLEPSNYPNSRGVFAWSGAAFDSKRNRLVLWGGGHNDYYGNELYAFSLSTFEWERLTNPSAPTYNDACRPILFNSFGDETPNSRHTYYNLAYLPPPTDKFFSTPGGTTSCDASGLDDNTWTFDFDTKEWASLQSGKDDTQHQPPGWDVPTASAYNPLDNKVYTTGAQGLFVYDVEKNRWERLNDGVPLDRGAVVDTKRNLLVLIGKPPRNQTLDKGVVVYDLKNQNYEPQYWDTLGGEFIVENQEYDDGEVRDRYRPGVNYDPVIDRIVIWDGGAVRALNMDTKHWDVLSTPDQKPFLTGTYGRFRYSSQKNAYVLVNDARKNVLIYKLANDAGVLKIVAQPTALVVDQGQEAMFSVLAVGPEAEELSYQWRKNGIDIDGATSAYYRFTASDTEENDPVFSVAVSAGSSMVISADAALTVIADTTAPTVVAVGGLSPHQVPVIFSERVTQASAEHTANYAFSPAASVDNATLMSNGQAVLLSVTGLIDGGSYKLTLNGITDLAPTSNMIATDTEVDFIYRTSEGFEGEHATAGFEPLEPLHWEVKQDTDGDKAYYLNTSDANSPGKGLLGEYSLLPGIYDDVTFSLNARSAEDLSKNGFADLALLFGYQDKNNYYYLMLNSGKGETKLFKVASGSRSELAKATDTGTDKGWLNDNNYHAIEIVHNGSQISATIDGNALLSAIDATFSLGRLGVGSFNDSAYFDDVSVTGVTSVIPADIAPVITLTGANPQELIVGMPYTDLGARAQDNIDGDITGNIENDISALDTTQVGSYRVYYNVVDSDENAADEVTRTVNVVAATSSDNIAPVITLIGADAQELTVNTPYTDLGATALDNVDGDITDNIVIQFSAVDTNVVLDISQFDTTQVGSYRVYYNVSDSDENAADEVSRTVNVVAATSSDNIAPIITLAGANPQEIAVNTPYTDLGARAQDNIDGDITDNIVIQFSAVDTNVVLDISQFDTTQVGSYRVYYNVSDSDENAADEVSRIVNVTAPVASNPDDPGGGGGGGALGPLTGMGFMLLLLGFRVVRQRGVI